jgi:hypothetical protein
MKKYHSKSGSRYEKRAVSLNEQERQARAAWESGYADGYASGIFFYQPLEINPKAHDMYKAAYIKGFNDFKGSHEIKIVNLERKYDKENHPAELM